MNTTAEYRRHMGNTALDALALIGAAYRGDVESGSLLLSTYADPAEREELYGAILAHVVCILRHVVGASGISPEGVLGAVAQTIREDS
jgi:hypothetical protein